MTNFEFLMILVSIFSKYFRVISFKKNLVMTGNRLWDVYWLTETQGRNEMEEDAERLPSLKQKIEEYPPRNPTFSYAKNGNLIIIE